MRTENTRLIRYSLYLFNRIKGKPLKQVHLTDACQENETREFRWFQIENRCSSSTWTGERVSLNEKLHGFFSLKKIFFSSGTYPKGKINLDRKSSSFLSCTNKKKSRRDKMKSCLKSCSWKCGGIQSTTSEWRNFQITKKILAENPPNLLPSDLGSQLYSGCFYSKLYAGSKTSTSCVGITSFSRALQTPERGWTLKKSYLHGSSLQEQDYFEESKYFRLTILSFSLRIYN